MRTLWNHLSDPSLHLLAIALLLVYLTVCRGSWSDEARASAPLSHCKVCHAHFLPGDACQCPPSGVFAHAWR